MRFKRLLAGLLLVLSILHIMPVTAFAASPTAIIQQLINYYRYHQESAQTDIQRLLSQLEEVDARQAESWQSIMDSWSWLNTELDLNADTLPDGLPDDDSLCIIVMGYQLTSSGKMRNELVGRLRVALDAANKYPNAYILVTGGATASGNTRATEAGRMADWLVANGISSSRIIRETQAYSTEANAIYSLRLLKNSYPQVKHIALVTSDYHMKQSYLLFAARQYISGDGLIEMAGAACYDTGSSSRYTYTNQANAIAAIAGVNISNMDQPALSHVTELGIRGETFYMLGEELELTVTAVYNTDYSRDITSEASFSGYDPNTLGTQTVRLEYSENGYTATCSVQIVVEEPIAEEVAAAAEPPETVPQTEIALAEATENPAEKNTVSLWWLLLIIPALISGYEFHERQERIRRRNRRRRKKMNWE